MKLYFNPFTGTLDWVSEEDLSGYVPYSGATNTLNMGAHSVQINDAQAFQVGEITISTEENELFIINPVVDKDITIKINDGGSSKTALFIDSSNSFMGIWNDSPERELDVKGIIHASQDITTDQQFGAEEVRKPEAMFDGGSAVNGLGLRLILVTEGVPKGYMINKRARGAEFLSPMNTESKDILGSWQGWGYFDRYYRHGAEIQMRQLTDWNRNSYPTDIVFMVTGDEEYLPSDELILTSKCLYPAENNSVNLGSESKNYKDLYIDGIAYIDNLELENLSAGTDNTVLIMDGNTVKTDEINEDVWDTEKNFVDGTDLAAYQVAVAADSDTIASENRFMYLGDGKLQLHKDGGGVPLELYKYFTGSGGPGSNSYKARGTKASPANVVADDTVFAFNGKAYHTSDWRSAGAFRCKVDTGTLSATSMPGKLIFYTCPDGTTTLTERMLIREDGDVEILSGDLEVIGAGKAVVADTFKNYDSNMSFSSQNYDMRFFTGSGDLIMDTEGWFAITKDTPIFQALGLPADVDLDIEIGDVDQEGNGTKIHLDDSSREINIDNALFYAKGGNRYAYVEKTANYTVSAFDYQINCTANSFTISLITAVGRAGQVYSIKNTGTGTITIDAYSTQTIDGELTQELTQWDNIQLMSDGANWIII